MTLTGVHAGIARRSGSWVAVWTTVAGNAIHQKIYGPETVEAATEHALAHPPVWGQS